ncbi:MAG: cytochrome c3 family protein [Magnetococcales bacterium]|nr:cytochrome c3 family protein [Magnetococcales bacterium]
MNVILCRFLYALLVALLVSGTPNQGRADSGKGAAKSDQSCLRCHGMETLAYLDPATGGLKNLAIDVKAMRLSDHGKLGCRDCHAAGFEAYPHFQEARQQRLECLGCHREESRTFSRALFESIERGFSRSIHYQSMPDSFDCFSCHDPHNFRSLAGQSPDHFGSVVARDNAPCRSCHDSPRGLFSLTGRLFTALEQTHAWLPEPARHWSKVRCIECHTGSQGERDTHFILGRQNAVRACEACHSRDSILATKLYRHRIREERRTAGFIHSAVMNDAYIIGMTRNQWLDWGGIGLIVLAIVGVSAHGLARYLVARSTNHETHR